jgi:hypothetical protein
LADIAASQPSDTLDLASYRRMFAESRDLLGDNRREQQTDDDYYHGYQLTEEEKRVLNERGQPTGIFNRYRKAINGTLGVLEGGKSDPRAYGRNPGVDEEAADVVTKTLRYAADVNDFTDLRLECAYDYLVPGVCAALVEVDEMRRPKLTQIRWEEFFYDPRSRKKDFSDARYLGVAKWMYADDVQAQYPDKKRQIDDTMSDAFSIDDTFEDRPTNALSNWIDRKKRRLMVVEIYHRQGGKWLKCCFHAGGILAAEESPYLDEKGKPTNPIVAQSCYVDRQINRLGIGRDMRSPQDEFNKRRQKSLHILNNRQLFAQDPGSFMPIDADEARAEAARPDGIIPPGWQPVSQTDLATGQFNLLALAESELDRQGPNPAILARANSDASGRSKQVDQQAGLTEDAVVYKGIHKWELRIYRAMWDRCRQFMTAPDYIRVTDDQGAAEFVGINQPQVVMNPQTGMIEQKTDNELAQLDVDIILDTVPDTATLMQEQFETLTQLAQAYGPQEVPFDDILEVSSLPDKAKLIEKRKARQEQAQQAGGMGQQLQMLGAQQQIRETAASAGLKEAQTDKARADTLKAQAEAVKLGVEAQVKATEPHIEMFKLGTQSGPIAA